MNILSKRNLLALATGTALVGSLAFAGTALAATPNVAGHEGQKSARPAIVGTVASAPDASGTFTVTAKSWKRGTTTATPTTYTVTTSSATTFAKGGAASTVSAIAVGDTVNIQGTVTGTSVAATRIIDGKMMGRLEQKNGEKPEKPDAPRMQPLTGNGQPIIGGNVTAITGNILTVLNKSNVTYTVDVSSTTVSKAGVTGATTSSIAVGDSLIVQGTINGTSVTASSVIDQGTLPTSSDESKTAKPEARGGFMGAIGGFFSHMFGFF